MHTTSLMSSYEGSVGTNSWYGNWYSSRIPALGRSQTKHTLFRWSLAFRKSLSRKKGKRNYPNFISTSRDTASSDLPEDEPKAVHVGHDVRLKMTPVQSLVQNLWRHVALCTNSGVGRDVNLICVTAELEIKLMTLKWQITWLGALLNPRKNNVISRTFMSSFKAKRNSAKREFKWRMKVEYFCH